MKQSSRQLVHLNKDESYIASKSIIELGGLYRSRFSDHLREMHKEDYDRIKAEIDKSDCLQKSDILIVLETLYLLIHEMSDGDFLALYDDVTKDDVKALYGKLEKINENELKL